MLGERPFPGLRALVTVAGLAAEGCVGMLMWLKEEKGGSSGMWSKIVLVPVPAG